MLLSSSGNMRPRHFSPLLVTWSCMTGEIAVKFRVCECSLCIFKNICSYECAAFQMLVMKLCKANVSLHSSKISLLCLRFLAYLLAPGAEHLSLVGCSSFLLARLRRSNGAFDVYASWCPVPQIQNISYEIHLVPPRELSAGSARCSLSHCTLLQNYMDAEVVLVVLQLFLQDNNCYQLLSDRADI